MNTFNNPDARARQYLRTFATEYNQIIRTHSEMMVEYNRNVGNIIRLLEEYGPAPTHSNDSQDIATIISLLAQSNQNRLTQNQIENATENVVYTSEAFPDITQCPISLDDFEENEVVCRIRYCHHMFKRNNIMRWFETHTGCPVCRHNLREFTPASIWANIFNRISDASGDILEVPVRF